MINKLEKRIRRHGRVRSKVKGVSEKPRVSIFRSNKHIFAQIIDDASGKTIASANDTHGDKIKGTKMERATKLGEILAQSAKKAGVTAVVFDRGGYKYHGRVKAFADALRKESIKF